jgi:hypothetical protein
LIIVDSQQLVNAVEDFCKKEGIPTECSEGLSTEMTRMVLYLNKSIAAADSRITPQKLALARLIRAKLDAYTPSATAAIPCV